MQIKWKANKHFKPGFIFEKINNCQNNYFDMVEASTALQSMITLPNTTSSQELDLPHLIKQVLTKVEHPANLTKDSFLAELISTAKNNLATKEAQYHILTSASVTPAISQNKITVEYADIEILNDDFPDKVTGKYGSFVRSKSALATDIPESYSRIIVSIKSKSARAATKKAIRALDLLRSIWCFFGNIDSTMLPDEHEPINVVRLGPYYTAHDNDGAIMEEFSWYEPNYIEAEVYQPTEPEKYQQRCEEYIARLDRHPYGRDIKESLIRYVRALDERNQNITLVRLWSALESIAAPNDANCDKISNRCAFLFSESQYHKQILEHLREYRNANIHAGEEVKYVKVKCFLLQRYFRELIQFHLKTSGRFTSINDANKFLDLPFDKKSLMAQKELIESAIEFVS